MKEISIKYKKKDTGYIQIPFFVQPSIQITEVEYWRTDKCLHWKKQEKEVLGDLHIFSHINLLKNPNNSTSYIAQNIK